MISPVRSLGRSDAEDLSNGREDRIVKPLVERPLFKEKYGTAS
jgi:hypothetical protein